MKLGKQNSPTSEWKGRRDNAILESLPLLICLFDRQKKIVNFDQGSFLLEEDDRFSMSLDVGRTIVDYLHDASSPYYKAFVLLNDAFDRLLHTGTSQYFRYEIGKKYYETTLIVAGDDRIAAYIRQIAPSHKTGIDGIGMIELPEQEIVETNKRLKEIVHQNEMIMNNANSGFVYLTPDYKVVWENISIVYGRFGPQKFYRAGAYCYESFNRTEPCENCVMRRVLGNRKPSRSEFGGVDGMVVEIFGNPIMDANGQIEGVILRIDDITERKEQQSKMEKSEQKLATANQLLTAIIDCMPCSFYIKDVDDDFKYIVANRRFHKQLKTELHNFIGMTDYDLFEKQQAEQYRINDIEIIQSGETIDLREETVDLNGKHQIWHCTKTPLRLTEVNRNLLVGIALDITEDVSKQEELERAKKRAEQSDALKSAFLANMSHEIRTPLNAIVGFARLIHSVSEEERDTYLDIIDSNSDLLLKLIGDILDLSKIEAGYVDYTNTRFDLVTLFTELEMMFRNKVQSGVTLINRKTYEQCYVVLDRLRTSQLISNFLTNALKFTMHGTVEMGYKTEANGVKLYVKDTGCGISEENQTKVFDRFEKFNNFTQGNGLGMPICKAIAEAYSGEIGFTSKVGEGSEFWVYLPTEIETSDQPKVLSTANMFSKEESRKLYDKSLIKVLLAEDNDSNFILIKTILKGYNLTRVFNGADAVECVRNEYFDLVLMDMRMPVMDGLKATRTIRQFNRHIPIVALTANAFESDRKEALEAGCNDFITKPIDKNKLLIIMGDILTFNQVQLFT